MSESKRVLSKVGAWFILAYLIVGLGLTYRLVTPPPASKEETKETLSLTNIQAHLDYIANKPRPVGSAHHDTIFNYLVEHARSLKLEYTIQDTIVSRFSEQFKGPKKTNYFSSCQVKNLIVRIPGQDTTSAVLITGHYDSVEGSYGAGDDGASIAGMMDLMRWLSEQETPKRDVFFLFADAEEKGLFGAFAFTHHPIMNKVDVCINAEGRGSGGVSLMFETTDPNKGVITDFVASKQTALASSVMFEVYNQLMSNDTDFTMFKEANISGINYAFIKNLPNYHTPIDHTKYLDMNTVMHQMNNIKAITKFWAFQKDQFERNIEGNLTYFNLPWGEVFAYPNEWNFYGCILLFLFWLIGLAQGSSNQLFGFMGSMQAAVTFLIITALVVGSLWLILWGINTSHSHYKWLEGMDLYNSSIYFFAFTLMGSALWIFLVDILIPRNRLLKYTSGVLFIWIVLGFFASFTFAGGAYLLVLPALCTMPAWLYLAFCTRTTNFKIYDGLIVGAFTVPIITTLLPVVILAHWSLTTQMLPLILILWILMLGLFSPALRILTEGLGWSVPFLMVISATVLLMYASLTSLYNEDHKKPNSIVYAYDADSYESNWFSYDPMPDDFTSQFLGQDPDITQAGIFNQFGRNRTILVKEDSVRELLVPVVIKTDDRVIDDIRSVMFSIKSLRNAQYMRFLMPKGQKIQKVYANNRLIYLRNEAEQDPLRYFDLHVLPGSAEGLSLTFILPSEEKLERFGIIEVKGGLGDVWKEGFRPRLDYMMSRKYSTYLPTDVTIIKKSYHFTDDQQRSSAEDLYEHEDL